MHVTPKINTQIRAKELISKVTNPRFVARHAFFPLIHSIIKERKYKKHPHDSKIRSHSHFIKGEYKPSAKNRPLHYATHIDALVFGYYAEILLNKYEQELDKHLGLSDCVIAYRKIALSGEDEIGKSTINFAHEAFSAIAKHAEQECAVLMFDIKSFFSELDHHQLKSAWCSLLGVRMLPKDHFNVFNAATNFRYILRDELRLKGTTGGKRKGFDERKLAEIRKVHGKECFFESLQDFRHAISAKQINVYRRPFVKDNVPVGIPQGLPISAVLANLYLYKFDVSILSTIVKEFGGFYRRYSDDILIICKKDQVDKIKQFVRDEILKSKVTISEEKTETYIFKVQQAGNKSSQIISLLVLNDGNTISKPLTYLGFEFYGNKALIKSANLSKFYRRMIYSVKRKAFLAAKLAEQTGTRPVVFRGRLKRLYSKLKLNSVTQYNTHKRLKLKADGFYDYDFVKSPSKHNSNYFSYARRAGKLMDEQRIISQLKKHKAIFNIAIARHLKRAVIKQSHR